LLCVCVSVCVKYRERKIEKACDINVALTLTVMQTATRLIKKTTLNLGFVEQDNVDIVCRSLDRV